MTSATSMSRAHADDRVSAPPASDTTLTLPSQRPLSPSHDDTDTLLGTARFSTRHYEIAFSEELGGPLALGGTTMPVTLTGLHFVENHGYVGKVLAIVLAAAGSGRAGLSDNAVRDLWSADYLLEVHAYVGDATSATATRARGRGAEVYFGGEVQLTHGALPWVLQLAANVSYLSADRVPFRADAGPTDGGGANDVAQSSDPQAYASAHVHEIDYVNVGLMTRLHVPLSDRVEVSAQWDANLLQLFAGADSARRSGTLYTSPLRLAATFDASDSLFARATLSMNAIGLAGVGGQVAIGVRL
ncbi:MAG: hypothetical protein ACHREM_10020 [Polyangiales bacterium]